uniref:Retrovirus-related Pol polyprotein from transposon TNT 1-94-like beta-barrel domain-containing protein n=1 Tax=Strigamia maritima TaxID=126957 RepID=T1IHZ9_STRMM
MNVTLDTNEWIWDTGSGAHLCYDKNLFIQLTRGRLYKMNAYSGTFDVEGVGTVRFNLLIGRVNHRITLNNVGFAPSGKRNLISGSRTMKAGCSWTNKQDEILVKNKNNKPMLKFIRGTGLFKLNATKNISRGDLSYSDVVKNGVPVKSKVNVPVVENKPNGDLGLWHRRLMYTNIDTLVKMSKENFDTNNEKDQGNVTPTPTPTPIPKPEQTKTRLISPKTEQLCVDIWERRAKQRPQTGSHPGHYDATLSHRGQTFRSTKAVIKYCEDNSIGYSLESVKDSFKYNNPYIGTWDIAKVADGEEQMILLLILLMRMCRQLLHLSKRFSNFAFKEVAEPFKVGFDLAELNLESDILDSYNYPYRTLVGILLFVSRYTRPDICIAIINCFVDASWATSPGDRKSITGCIICIGNNPVIWCTAKQILVTISAMESELIALSELTKEIIWFKRLLNEFSNVRGVNFSQVSVNCDNRAAIHFICNNYIDVKLQFVKQNYQAGLFDLRYVYTKKNLADILTKRVNREKIDKLCRYLSNKCERGKLLLLYLCYLCYNLLMYYLLYNYIFGENLTCENYRLERRCGLVEF